MNEALEQILACAGETWSPQIGDPTIMGWVTVGVYLLVGVVSALVAIRAPFPLPSVRRERIFWVLVTILMLALAVNKQLDLQSFATAAARCTAKLQGWYGVRRTFQIEVILSLLAAMAVFAVMLGWAMRDTLWRNGLALIGVVFVLAFVAVRAVGFHHMDAFLNSVTDQGVRVNWMLELTGPALVMIAGLTRLRTR